MVQFRTPTFSIVMKGKRAYYKVKIGNRMMSVDFATANQMLDKIEEGEKISDKALDKIMLWASPEGYEKRVDTLKENLKTAIMKRYPDLMYVRDNETGIILQEKISKLIDETEPDDMYILSKLQPKLFYSIFRYNQGEKHYNKETGQMEDVYLPDNVRLVKVRDLMNRLIALKEGKSGWF